MRLFIFSIVCLTLISCMTSGTFVEHNGLTFNELDWRDAKLEQPFVVNSYVSENLSTKENKLYLPAVLFEDVKIKKVYYKNLVSTDIDTVAGRKKRLRVYFHDDHHKCEDRNYDLSIDEAIVEIQVEDHQKIIKVQNIRVPSDN